MFDQWLQNAIDHAKVSQSELSRRLHAHFRWPDDRSIINKAVKGRRKLTAKELLEVSEETGFPLPIEDMASATRVPHVSLVSAGNLRSQEGIKPEDIDRWVHVADLPAGDWVALTVEGDSMNRIAPDGALILVDRSTDTLLDGRFYVFSLEGGEATFKRYRRDPAPMMQPFSTNPDHMSIAVDDGLYVFGRVRRIIHDV